MKRLWFITKESIRSALSALWSNKLRSFLTFVGIVIGVMTVIAILSVINGLNKTMRDTFANLGTRVLYVERRSWSGDVGGGRHSPFRKRGKKRISWWRFPRMRDRELTAIENASLAEYVVPTTDLNYPVTYKDIMSDGVNILGTGEHIVDVRPLELEKGRFFTPFEANEARFVCVVGYNVYNELFGENDEENGIDKMIQIGSSKYKVIGKLEKMGQMQMGFNSDSEDNTIYIPIKTHIKQFGRWKGYDQILVSAYIEEDLDALEDELRSRLRRVRNVPTEESDNFGINRQSFLLEEFNKTSKTLWMFVIGISALSLLVGGIGVMNIMLISVTERTKEIGLRKALGAKRSHILFQFLLEALIICWLGGALGIFLGISFAFALSIFTPVPFALSVNSIYIGFLFTSSVGLFFGIYPAAKASRKDPVVALRYE